MEVERDSVTGEVSAVIWFRREVSAPGLTVTLDDAVPVEEPLECATQFCVLILSPARIGESRRMTLQLTDRSGPSPAKLGPPRVFELAAP